MTTKGPYHKTYKHGSRVRPYQLERYSTIKADALRACFMLDGVCDCKTIDDCKYIEEVEDKENKEQIRRANLQAAKKG